MKSTKFSVVPSPEVGLKAWARTYREVMTPRMASQSRDRNRDEIEAITASPNKGQREWLLFQLSRFISPFPFCANFTVCESRISWTVQSLWGYASSYLGRL